jgi:hypothetical protein
MLAVAGSIHPAALRLADRPVIMMAGLNRIDLDEERES